jgi:hypothetical protein
MAGLRYQEAMNRFLSQLPEPVLGKVVELAARRGEYAIQFLEKGYRVFACDLVADLQLNEDSRERLMLSNRQPLDIAMPFRTCAGVFGANFLAERTSQDALIHLRLFMDWLIPGGICYFSFYEGEGVKRIAEQGVHGRTERLLVYYQPEEIENMVYASGLETIDAWRDQSPQPTIHIIVRRPQ